MADYVIDYNKARHEIPLVDLQNGEVRYGVDALAEILNQRFLFVKPMLKIMPLNRAFKKLYRLISYNRKIIVAKPGFQNSCFDCSPDYSFRHRFYLIVLSWSITTMLLVNMVGDCIKKTAAGFQPLVLCVWMLVVILMIAKKPKKQAFDIAVHIGIIMVVAIIIFKFLLHIFQLLFTPSSIFYFVAIVPAMCWIQWQTRRRIVFHQQQYNG